MITPKEDYPESKHNYADYLTENYAYRYPNAKSLKVKFSDKCKTEHNIDYITIYDANGNKIGSYSGRQLAGKTLNIPTGAYASGIYLFPACRSGYCQLLSVPGIFLY